MFGYVGVIVRLLFKKKYFPLQGWKSQDSEEEREWPVAHHRVWRDARRSHESGWKPRRREREGPSHGSLHYQTARRRGDHHPRSRVRRANLDCGRSLPGRYVTRPLDILMDYSFMLYSQWLIYFHISISLLIPLFLLCFVCDSYLLYYITLNWQVIWSMKSTF